MAEIFTLTPHALTAITSSYYQQAAIYHAYRAFMQMNRAYTQERAVATVGDGESQHACSISSYLQN